MPEKAVVDSPQAGAVILERPDEMTPANVPDGQEPEYGAQPPAATEPPLSLADAIRAKFKSKKKTEEASVPEKGDKAQSPKPDKPKAKKKSEPDPRPDVDPIKLAEAQGREMGDRIAERLRPAPQEKESPAVPTDAEIAKSLPEEYRADADVYVEMKRLFPEKHGTILARLKDAAEKETKYIEQWEAAHPDETYDPDDTAHNSFYKKTFPDIPERDFKSAERSIAKAQTKAEVKAEMDALYGPELEKLKREKEADKIAPVIAQRIGDVIESALGAIDEKLTGIARDSEKLNALQETNPVAAEVIGAIHQTFNPVMAANVALHNNTVQFSQDNPVHIELFKLAKEIETKTAAAPLEQRMDSQGRVFATREQYRRMNAEDQARHWFVDQDVLAYVVIKKAASTAKQWYDSRQEQFKKWAKASGVEVPSASKTAQTNGQPAPKEPAKEPPAEDETPSPPSPGRGQLPSPWTQGEAGPKTGADFFLRHMKGR